jgi:hypothetical protein
MTAMSGQDRDRKTQDDKGLAQKGVAQPESLAEFDAAARHGGVKPENQGLTANADTAPRPDDPKLKDKTATEVLRAGVEKNPQAATRAAQSKRDPRTDR